MTARALIMAALALIGIGYLLIEFGRLVLDDLTAQRDAGEDAAYDAETVAWLHALAEPNSEFDAWCEQGAGDRPHPPTRARRPDALGARARGRCPMKHRATSVEAAHIAAMKDFAAACKTAVDLYRRRHHGRGDWALVRAGRRVALAFGVPFEDHPLGDLVYVDPCKITPADIARQRQARAAAAAQAGVLS